jgi:hypothetical protein
MEEKHPRRYIMISGSIVAAAFIIGASLFLALSFGYGTGRTPGATVTSTLTANPYNGTRLYEVTFKQTGACGPPPVYAAPWSVTLGPWTLVEPQSAGLPVETLSGTASLAYADYSAIVFSVPAGSYPYSIAMGWPLGNPSGVVTVTQSDVNVTVDGPFVACTTVAQTSG